MNSEPTQQLKQKKWRSQHNSGIRIWSHTKLIHKDMFNIQTQSSYNLHGSIFDGTPKPIMGLIHAPWLPICCDWQCMFVSNNTNNTPTLYHFWQQCQTSSFCLSCSSQYPFHHQTFPIHFHNSGKAAQIEFHRLWVANIS